MNHRVVLYNNSNPIETAQFAVTGIKVRVSYGERQIEKDQEESSYRSKREAEKWFKKEISQLRNLGWQFAKNKDESGPFLVHSERKVWKQ